MAQILISKIKIRRGLDSQIKSTVFDQGELVSSIDTQRLFIGTGTGRHVVGSRNFTPITNFNSISTIRAEIGDIVPWNNRVYQLTATDFTNLNSWRDISSLSVDTRFFNLSTNYTLTVNPSSLSASLLNPTTVLSGLKIENGVLQSRFGNGLKIVSNALEIDFNTKSLEVSANALSLKQGGIDEREIASSTLSSGLTGGSGSKIRLSVNPTYFNFLSTGQLNLRTSAISSDLSASISVDNASITRTVDNKIQIANRTSPMTQDWARITVDQYGLTTSLSSSIFDCLTGDSSLSAFNSTSPLSGIFNGVPQIENLSSNPLSSNVVFFTAVSSNGVSSETITLTSAGFITFQNSQTTRTGKQVSRFAIPIFSY